MRCLQNLLLAYGGLLAMSPRLKCSLLYEFSFDLLGPESRLWMELRPSEPERLMAPDIFPVRVHRLKTTCIKFKPNVSDRDIRAVEARSLRLSSPAATQGCTLGRNSWQRQFMNEVEDRDMRVDFMAVHYYSNNGNVTESRN